MQVTIFCSTNAIFSGAVQKSVAVFLGGGDAGVGGGLVKVSFRTSCEKFVVVLSHNFVSSLSLLTKKTDYM